MHSIWLKKIGFENFLTPINYVYYFTAIDREIIINLGNTDSTSRIPTNEYILELSDFYIFVYCKYFIVKIFDSYRNSITLILMT